MSATLSLTEEQTLVALRSYLLTVLPTGIEVVDGLDNRVPEPTGPDFLTLTPMLRGRLSTNVDTYQDCAFTASVSGTTLTVTEMSLGTIVVGATLFGTGITSGTTITAEGTGTGGIGTYAVNQSQTIASEIMASGSKSMLQATQVTVQIDVHGPNSGDNAQIITTTFRDEYAVDAFASSGFDVAPLYADDGHQMPFLNGEQQIEERWVISAVMQCNPIVSVPQQFASDLNADLVDITAQYTAT